MTTQHTKSTSQQEPFVGELLVQLQRQQQQVEELDRQEAKIRLKWEDELRDLSEKREKAKMVVRHLQALLALHGHSQPDLEPLLEIPQGKARPGAPAQPKEAPSLADLAYQFVLQAGKEYHYRDLAKALLEKGVNIPGSDPANSLVARIHDDPRLIRPRRGVYALREWYPGGQSVGTRKRVEIRSSKVRKKPKERGKAAKGG